MIRVKIPQGILDAAQLTALADSADTWSRGFGHITTRQNVQFHFVQPHDVEKVMRRIAEAGLTSREACGSAFRNITGCPYAGVAADEVFDVTPYAEEMTRYLLRHPLSSSLPRKFKIAFEGCESEDHALTAINDLGFRARIHNGERGFHLVAGGGTSTVATSASVLYDSCPRARFEVAEAGPRLPPPGRLQAQAAQPDEVPDPELGWTAGARSSRRSCRLPGRGGAPFSFPPDHLPVESAPDWPAGRASVAECARAPRRGVRGPGIVPETPRPVVPACATTCSGRARTCGRSASPGTRW